MDMKKKILIFSAVLNAFIVLTPLLVDLIVFLCAPSYEQADLTRFNSVSPLVTVIFLGIIFLIELISAQTIYDSTYHTVALTFSFLFYFLTCASFVSDMEQALQTQLWRQLFECLNYAAFLLSICSLFWYFRYLFVPAVSAKRFFVASLCAMCISIALYAGLDQFGYGYVVAIISLAIALGGVIWLYVYSLKHVRITFNFFFLLLIFSCLIGSEAIYVERACGSLEALVIDWQIIYSFLLISAYVSIYINFIAEKVKGDEAGIGYGRELRRIKPILLSEQIKPHYIFNTLNSIKALYKKDPALGEKAVDLLARHLRNHVALNENKMIPFAEELSNINNFVELENLKREQAPYNIIYDIDRDDFEIPILSIEPFVENAVKYSGIDKKDDGFLQISAYAENECAHILVKDNGVGFDVSSVSGRSTGIKNSKQRLEIMLGANVDVRSAPQEGTEISIEFPLGGGLNHAKYHSR